MLCMLEVTSVLLLYCLGTSRSPLLHGITTITRHYHFSYRHSIEDVVGLSCTRASILSVAYGLGAQSGHR